MIRGTATLQPCWALNILSEPPEDKSNPGRGLLSACKAELTGGNNPDKDICPVFNIRLRHNALRDKKFF